MSDDWRKRLGDAVAEDNAAHETKHREQQRREADAQANRRRAQDKLRDVVVPALEEVKEELEGTLGRSVTIVVHPDAETDPINAHLPGPTLAAYPHVTVSIARPDRDPLAFVIVVQATPARVRVSLAGGARDHRGTAWSGELPGDFDALDVATVRQAVLDHYQRSLKDSRPR